MSEVRLGLSEAWALRTSGPTTLLHHRVDGRELHVAGRGTLAATRALLLLRDGCTARALKETLALAGKEDARALLRMLRAEAAIRRLLPGPPPEVLGTAPPAAELRRLLARGGRRLPPLATLCPWGRARAPAAPPRAHVWIGLWGHTAFATRTRGQPCAWCLVLRLLGSTSEGEQDLTRLWAHGPRAAPPALRRALAATLLDELEQGLPGPGEAILARAGNRVARSLFLAHPDCGRCSPSTRRASRQAASAIRRALRAPPRAPAGQVRQALVDPCLGPLELEEVDAPAGRYPLDLPFVWGSVHLARMLGGRLASVSTYGGVYGSASSRAEGRLIALSEGVERLALRGVRPDVRGRARAFCHALDLVSGRACLVPFESVVVGLPAPLYPQGLRREPFYSGGASHVTFGQAVVHATVELIKRDAFMLGWYRRQALPRLSWPRHSHTLARRRLEYLRARGLSVELFDLSVDFPLPCLLLRVTARRSQGNWPRGGATLIPCGGFTPHEALEHGLGLACGQFVSLALHPAPFKNPLEPAAVRALGRRLPFWPLLARYLDPARASAHAFLGRGTRDFESLPSFPTPTVAGRIRLLRSWLAPRSLPWLVVRLTDRLASAAGFEVAKVVVPGLLSLAKSRATANLATPRMRQSWPLATCERPNPDPHPLY